MWSPYKDERYAINLKSEWGLEFFECGPLIYLIKNDLCLNRYDHTIVKEMISSAKTTVQSHHILASTLWETSIFSYMNVYLRHREQVNSFLMVGYFPEFSSFHMMVYTHFIFTGQYKEVTRTDWRMISMLHHQPCTHVLKIHRVYKNQYFVKSLLLSFSIQDIFFAIVDEIPCNMIC